MQPTGTFFGTPLKSEQQLNPSSPTFMSPMPGFPTDGVQMPFQHNIPHTSPYTAECLCPTCKYYTALAVYQRELSQSPPTDANAFAALFSPQHSATLSAYMNAYMMLSQYDPSLVAQSLQMSPSQPQTEPEVVVGSNVQALCDQFKMCNGVIASTACNPRGRAFLQAVMRLQHLEKIQQIYEEVVASIDAVALDPHGCHVVRTLIESLEPNQVNSFVHNLTEKLILSMATSSQYTRRTIQVLFERHRNCALDTVIEVLARNARYLAATQQGCICLMRVFEQCSYEHRVELLDTLLPVLPELACDPFGNYVVQCILEHSERPLAEKYVMERFGEKFLKISCNKFGSNVMEKVVQTAPNHVRRVILDELVFNPASIQLLTQDGFGNFVLQAIIETSSNLAEFRKISDRVRAVIHGSPYGHKIEAKLRSKRFFGGAQPPPKPKANEKENVAPAVRN